MLNVSADLPFAQARFCGAEGIEGVTNGVDVPQRLRLDATASRSADGPMAGLLSRAVVVVDGDGVVTYTEQVPEIGQEPDYDSALAALG